LPSTVLATRWHIHANNCPLQITRNFYTGHLLDLCTSLIFDIALTRLPVHVTMVDHHWLKLGH